MFKVIHKVYGTWRFLILLIFAIVTFWQSNIETSLADPPIEVHSIEQREEEREVLSISGVSYVLAAMLGKASIALDLDKFQVVIPRTKDQHLCLTFQTLDGRYVATPVYNISKSLPDIYTLTFETQYRDLLHKYSGEEFIISARTSAQKCEDPSGPPTSITGWGGDHSGDTMLTVFVHSTNKYARLELRNESGDILGTVECKAITDDKPRRIYDKSCEINLKEYQEVTEGWLTITDFGEPVGSERLQFSLEGSARKPR